MTWLYLNPGRALVYNEPLLDIHVPPLGVCLRLWRRQSWQPFLYTKTVLLGGGVFGFCFMLMRRMSRVEREMLSSKGRLT